MQKYTIPINEKCDVILSVEDATLSRAILYINNKIISDLNINSNSYTNNLDFLGGKPIRAGLVNNNFIMVELYVNDGTPSLKMELGDITSFNTLGSDNLVESVVVGRGDKYLTEKIIYYGGTAILSG